MDETREGEEIPRLHLAFTGCSPEGWQHWYPDIAVTAVTRLSYEGNLPSLFLSAVLIADTVFT